jgi:hypothetical protein
LNPSRKEAVMEHWHLVSIGFLSAAFLFCVGILVLTS